LNIKGRNFLTLKDYRPSEITGILDFAKKLKQAFKQGQSPPLMEGKMMAMIFQKPSLRTRVSFETGMFQLGGSALYLGPSDIGLGKRESVEDIARVLSAQVDIIMARVFGHEIVEELAEFSSVPVINGLSDFTHPCQALADFQTIQESGKDFKGLKLTYIGDGNNVANSLVFGGLNLGMHVFIASPKGFQVSEEVQSWARQVGSETGGSLEVTEDPRDAAQEADVLYTDVWASMGQESESEARKVAFSGYTIDRELLGLAKDHAIVLHCLPAHYGDEITKDVVDSQNSRVFQQAENRLHAQKGLIALLAGNEAG
jgi:ornithine carbamoyltransferase